MIDSILDQAREFERMTGSAPTRVHITWQQFSMVQKEAIDRMMLGQNKIQGSDNYLGGMRIIPCTTPGPHFSSDLVL